MQIKGLHHAALRCNDARRAEAMRVLELWEQTHEGSRRERVFGARTGCVRDDARNLWNRSA